MTDDELKDLALRAQFDIAPDLEGETILPEGSFRDQFEIDSMNFLKFVIKLHEATGIDIPESDYPKSATLSGCIFYL